MPCSEQLKVFKNNLSSEFCEHVIKKFEDDPNKYAGTFSGGNVVDEEQKKSTDLMISKLSTWENENSIFFKCLCPAIQKYFSDVFFMGSGPPNCFDTGYQIQRTTPGKVGYDWHSDFVTGNFGTRVLTFIWYLNTVKEEGWTEFYDGKKIKPETGKLIIFPSTITYFHKGHPPKKSNKYIATGWIYDNKYYTNE